MCYEEEDLVRFHFGEMTKDEVESFRLRLENEPGLAERLEKLQQCLEPIPEPCGGGPAVEKAGTSKRLGDVPLESDEQEKKKAEAVPRGLAERTSDSVETLITQSSCDTLQGKRWCSFVDLLVGVIAVGLLALIIVPAVQSSRDAARRAACKENLHQIGQALIAYSQGHGGYFPRIAPQSNAGAFSMQLVEAGYFSRDDLSQLLLCPSSSLAADIAERRAAIVVPTAEEMRVAQTLLLDRLRRYMGGSYAYRLGHLEQGSYVPVRNRADCRSALLSDAPNAKYGVSHNHSKQGQNLLFQDGSVNFQRGCLAPGGADHLFLTAAGVVAAGQSRSDTVLAPSDASPGPVQVLYQGR